MKAKDLVDACFTTIGVMFVFALWRSSQAICHDSPCNTIERVIYFLFDEAWVVGIGALPVSILVIWAWHRATGRPN